MTIINLNDPSVDKAIKDAKPISGYCLMVDIVGSTKLKEKSSEEWIGAMAETFNVVRSWTPAPFLKTVGDQLMFWFSSFTTASEPWLVFHGLVAMQRFGMRLPIKAGFTRCENVYPISFIESKNDVYGRDIDLTARLVNLATDGEILMNRGMFDILQAARKLNANDEEAEQGFRRIQGPWSTYIKGFDNSIEIFKYPSE